MATCEDVRLVVVGHVDHGKSTLIGRLLHETGTLPEDKVAELEAVARRRGAAFEWANLMDALQAERDQNVTIDTAQIWLRWHDRRYVIIDAPGHRTFLKNMVTGASQADAALVLIDASEGVQEQSRRHGVLLDLLGIRQVIVLVNKMDLAGYREDAFNAVKAEYLEFLGEIGVTPLAIVPISARAGDNIARAADRMPWYAGGTVLDALRLLEARTPPVHSPFRLPVQDVYRFDHRRVVAGRVESGSVHVGDSLVFLPGGERSAVRSLEQWNRPNAVSAAAGDAVGLTLDDQIFVERGSIAALERDLPAVTSTFRARVFWLGSAPLVETRSYRLKATTQDVECDIASIDRIVDGASLRDIGREPRTVERNELADVHVRTHRPVVIDRYDEIPALGRFVLLDGLAIAGGGIALEVTGRAAAAPHAAANLTRTAGLVTHDERVARNRHRGAVVWFTGLSGAGKSTLAYALERALFERGVQTFVLDGDNIRYGLNADLGFSAPDRTENIRRVAEVAKLFAEAGTVAVTAFISPYRSDRLRARRIMQEGGLPIPFVEVHLDAPLEICEQRDPKGLYAKARDGRIRQFTGVSDPYEPPDNAEITLDTGALSVDACLERLLDYVATVTWTESGR